MTGLREFADKLGPSDSRVATCNKNINFLREIFSGKLMFKVDRFIPAGSYGRKTAIDLKFDVDLVIFLNMTQTSSDQTKVNQFLSNRNSVCNQIRQILRQYPNRINNLSESSEFGAFGVVCECDGIGFDILTAVNLHQDPHKQLQAVKSVVASIVGEKQKADMFNQLSTSVCESVNKMIENSSAHTHAMIRLAKYWMARSIPPNVTFSGKSSTIELLAFHVGETTNDINKAYKTFLDYLVNVDSIAIYFTSYYKESDIPQSCKRRPYLIDSVNPFNNRLIKFHDSSSGLRTWFQLKAKESLSKLEKYGNNNPNSLF